MKAPLSIAIVVLISASAAFCLLNRSNPIQLQKSESANPARPLLTRTATSLHAPVFTPSPFPLENRPVAEIAPQIDEIRDEVRKNPEGTPASLLFFASTMGKRFQVATLSQANATGFFEDLYSCIDDVRPISTTARALCLREGERLTHYYPVLRNNFDLLASKATPEVRRLALQR